MKRIAFVLLAMFFALNLSAQQNSAPQGKPRFNKKEFQQRMEAELTKKAELTPEEAKLFFPIYNELKEKQRGYFHQIHELKKKAGGDEGAYAATIARIKELQVESAQLEQNYYRRLVEVIPASKVFKVMKAEDDFHRRMVQGPERQRKREHDGKRGNWQRQPQSPQ
jgi:hypothetical protein